MLIVNKQEYNTLKEWLPPDTVVDSEIGTDAIVQGVEKNRMYERKELPDFLASVVDGRIFEQLKDLSNNKEAYEPFIIIEGLGFYDPRMKKWLGLKAYFDLYPTKKMSFYEALASFRAFGVGLILTMDKADTALFLTHQNLKLGKPKVKKDYPERRGFRKDWDNEKKKLYVLEAFGPATAKALLKWIQHNGSGGSIGQTGWLIEEGFEDLPSEDNSNELPKRITAETIANIKMESGRRIGETKAKEIWEVLFE